MQSVRAQAINVVLAAEPGPRVVGMRARERNERVVRRVGASLVAPQAVAELAADAPLLVARADVTFNVALFDALPQASGQVRRVGPSDGLFLLWGRAGELAPLLSGFLAGEGPAAERFELIPLDQRSVLPLSPPGSPAKATRALLLQAQKPTDGIVSRNLNRPVSRLFSRLFLALSMTPMHASVLNLAIGLLCAYFAAQTGYATMLLAGALFHFASAFDGVDGEMARTTLGESPRGAWVDTAVDNITYVACLVGVTVGWLREGVGPAGLVLASVVVTGVPLTLLVLMRFVGRYAPDGSLVFVDRCIARAASDSGRPSLRVARFLFHALRRDVFALAFFLLSFAGLRAAVPIAVAVGLAVALGTMLLHWPRLVAAAQALSPRGVPG